MREALVASRLAAKSSMMTAARLYNTLNARNFTLKRFGGGEERERESEVPDNVSLSGQ